MAGLQPAAAAGRAGGQLQHLLGDPAAGVGQHGRDQRGDLPVGRLRADHQALPAGAVDRLPDQLVGPGQAGGQHVRVLQAVGVDVREQRLLAEVVADQVRHPGVDELVVRDAVADPVRDGDLTGPRGVDQPRAADHAVRPEMERVQVVVVDPSVEHVDALHPLGGPHPDGAGPAGEVAALHQLDAHAAGQQRVLEVGGVHHPGGEHHHGGIVDAGGGAGLQGPEQPGGVLVHRPDPVGGQQLGERPGHRAPVLQHIADPRRGPQVVLQHLLAVGQVGQVGQQHLQRGDPLLHAALDQRPFGGGDQPRHQVEREGALLAVETEGDPLVAEGAGERGRAVLQLGGAQGRQRLVQAVRVLPGQPVGAQHLVPGRADPVAVKQITHEVNVRCLSFP